MSNPALIYLGPSGLGGWTTIDKSRKTSAWATSPEGHLSSSRADAELFRPLDIPERAEFEIALESSSRPDFLLALESRPQTAIRLETWDQFLVSMHGVGDDWEEVAELEEKGGILKLRLYWDRTTGELSAYSDGGKKLGETIKAPKRSRGKAGFYIRNKGDDLTLKRLRVNRWDGTPPREVVSGQNRIYLIDGTIKYGRLSGWDTDSQSVVLTSEREGDETETIALTEIDSIYLVDDETNEQVTDNLQVSWHDGGLVSGELVGVSDNAISLKTAYSDEPVVSALSRASRIRFPKLATPEHNDGVDLLEYNGRILHGTLAGGEGREEQVLTGRP